MVSAKQYLTAMPAGMGLAQGLAHSMRFIRELFIEAVFMSVSGVKANGQVLDHPPNVAMSSHKNYFIPG